MQKKLAEKIDNIGEKDAVPADEIITAVSYTHLDVYKRQALSPAVVLPTLLRSLSVRNLGKTCLLYTSRCV